MENRKLYYRYNGDIERGEDYMIYITGDCHGNFERFNASIFPEQKGMTKEDYVIICGDFGGVWNRDEVKLKQRYWIGWIVNHLQLCLWMETMKILNVCTHIRWKNGMEDKFIKSDHP